MLDDKLIKKMNEFLDVIESSKGPAVMVTLPGKDSKAYSSGFNLMAILAKKHNKVLIPMEMIDLYCRILTLNVPTLAVITGHCIAGGVFLAQCHDRVIMTTNPKFKMQLNESTAGIGMFSVYLTLLKEVLSPRTARTLILGGVVRSKEALELDLVQGLFENHEELKAQVCTFRDLRGPLAKNERFRFNLQNSKRSLWKFLLKSV